MGQVGAICGEKRPDNQKRRRGTVEINVESRCFSRFTNLGHASDIGATGSRLGGGSSGHRCGLHDGALPSEDRRLELFPGDTSPTVRVDLRRLGRNHRQRASRTVVTHQSTNIQKLELDGQVRQMLVGNLRSQWGGQNATYPSTNASRLSHARRPCPPPRAVPSPHLTTSHYIMTR